MKKLVVILVAVLFIAAFQNQAFSQSANCQVNISSNWQTTPDWTVFNPVLTTVCVGDDIDFAVTYDGSYDWTLTSTYPGFTSRSGLAEVSMAEIHANVVFTGTFDYTLTLYGTACNRDTTISVTILAPPIADVIADDETVCAGTTVNFTANGGTPGSSNYDWTVNGAPAPGHDPLLETYSYVPINGDLINCLISNGACADDDDVDVTMTVYDNPVAVATLDDVNLIGEFCDQQTAVISEINLDPTNIATYEFWVAGATLPNVLNDSTETWTVDLGTHDGLTAYIVVTDNNGCTSTSNVLNVNVSQLPDLSGPVTVHDACIGADMQFDLPGFNGETAGPWNVNFWDPTHTTQYTVTGSVPALPTSGSVSTYVDIPGSPANVHIQVIEITTGCLNFE